MSLDGPCPRPIILLPGCRTSDAAERRRAPAAPTWTRRPGIGCRRPCRRGTRPRPIAGHLQHQHNSPLLSSATSAHRERSQSRARTDNVLEGVARRSHLLGQVAALAQAYAPNAKAALRVVHTRCGCASIQHEVLSSAAPFPTHLRSKPAHTTSEERHRAAGLDRRALDGQGHAKPCRQPGKPRPSPHHALMSRVVNVRIPCTVSFTYRASTSSSDAVISWA